MDAHRLSGLSAKRRNPILHAVSPVSQNLYVESLNQFYIFWAWKYASFWHSAFFRNPFGKLSHLRAKYGKSPQKNLSIFTLRQHKFSPNVLIWSKYLWNGNYRMISFYWYVLCIGTLLCWHAYDVMFMGCNSHFGTQKNYATTTKAFNLSPTRRNSLHLWPSLVCRLLVNDRRRPEKRFLRKHSLETIFHQICTKAQNMTWRTFQMFFFFESCDIYNRDMLRNHLSADYNVLGSCFGIVYL